MFHNSFLFGLWKYILFHFSHRYFRVVVLVRLGSGFVVEFHGLLRTEVDAGEALRAVIATMGFAIRMDGVAGLCAARDDDEDVRLLGQLQSWQQFGYRPRRIEPVAGIDQPDAPLLRQILIHRLTERHHRFVESLRDVAADGQAVARAREIEDHNRIIST